MAGGMILPSLFGGLQSIPPAPAAEVQLRLEAERATFRRLNDRAMRIIDEQLVREALGRQFGAAK